MDELLKTLQRASKTGSADLDAEWLSDFVHHWRQLNEAERKAMVQLEAIRSKLISKETELSLLQADINMLAVDRDNKALEIDSLTSQLNLLKSENELSLQRIQTFESELEELRTKNSQLSEELFKKSEQLKCLREESLSKGSDEKEDKIKEFELLERDELIKEKVEQIRNLRGALDDALQAKTRLQNKYDKELRDLQQSNSTLVDDFEWKLHQVESNCRKKLLEKDKQIEEKIREAKQSSLSDNVEEREKLEEGRRNLQKQLREVEHLKAYEAEVVQLRGVTNEQQKSLRAASRQLEQLKLNERLLQSEIESLKKLLEQEKTHALVISNSAQRRVESCEKSMREKLEQEKAQLNKEWESKLQTECSRIKDELVRLHAEEKLSLETNKSKNEKDLQVAKQTWEESRQGLAHEISRLKEEIKTKESTYQRELCKTTTILDRDNWELRRKVEKMNDAHLEEIDTLKESHSEEMENLRQRYDNAVSTLEKLQKKVDEFEKTNRSTDSVETEKDSGIAADRSSIVDRTNNDDSECSTESEEEEEESEEEEEEEEEEYEESEEKETCKNPDNSIDELREEVANLQGSIETLTLNLVKTAGEGSAEGVSNGPKDTPRLMAADGGDSLSSDVESSSQSQKSPAVSSDTENESDVSPFFLIGVIGILSFMFFQSLLVVFWTYFALIAFRTLRPGPKNPKE